MKEFFEWTKIWRTTICDFIFLKVRIKWTLEKDISSSLVIIIVNIQRIDVTLRRVWSPSYCRLSCRCSFDHFRVRGCYIGISRWDFRWCCITITALNIIIFNVCIRCRYFDVAVRYWTDINGTNSRIPFGGWFFRKIIRS